MAMSMMRQSILCQIRAQTQTLNGRLRSLSYTKCDFLRTLSSVCEDQINTSLKTQPLKADPSNKLLDQLIVTTSLVYNDKDQIHASDKDEIHASDKDQINLLASFVTNKVTDIIKYGEPPYPLLLGAEIYVDLRFSNVPEVIKWNCMLRAIDLIKDFPEVDKIQLFLAKIYYESLLRDDSKCELTKDEIIARVLKVVHCYPEVSNCQVLTEETHFGKDLVLEKRDVIEIIQALQMEFKLDIPDDIYSCKLAIDYIYDHRMEKLCNEEFQKRIHMTGGAYVRKFYLRADENIQTKDTTMLESWHGKQPKETNWDGFGWDNFFDSMLL